MLFSGSRIQQIGDKDAISRDLTVHLSNNFFWKKIIVLSSHLIQPISTMAFDPSWETFTAYLERLD